MAIFHMLNIADIAFMGAGLGAALLMILVGAGDGRRAEPGATRPGGADRD